MGDDELCTNCRREIPAQNYRMHSLHCARNIKLCEECNEPIPINELEQHRETEHALKECPQCGEGIPGSKLQEHQDGPCSKRTIICKFCATHIEQGNQVEHENYCGSRTDKCQECGEFIMLKNFELHINSNHGFLKLKDEPGPKASWEQSTGSAVAKNTKITTSSYVSRYSKYSDPEPSTPQQRSNFSATELFNNQDLYSSRRYSSNNSTTVASATTERSYNSSSLSKSSSSSVVSSSLKRSSGDSIVERSLNQMKGGVVSSKSTSVVTSLMKEDKEAEEVEKLPCEFCEAMIPMYKLLSHQAECVNPHNVRENGHSTSTTTAASTNSSSYRAYSSLRSNHNDSNTLGVKRESRELSSARERSVTRSKTTGSIVSRHMHNGETGGEETKQNGYHATNGHEAGRKGMNGIVDRFSNAGSASGSNGYADNNSNSSYMGRSSYLLQEREERKTEPYKIKKSGSSAVVAGMYENDQDREGLRQMLNSMRRDPMDVEDDPDNNDGSFFPCEFCGDPYPCEYLMRHQMSCDLNPQPVSSGSGFDYNSIKNSIARNMGHTPQQPQHHQDQQQQQHQQQSHRLSRSSSTVERSYSRSTRSNSISRTSSFADRSYGTRTNLARKASFTINDYSSALRRSSVFDGYAGYSIYSSISEGLDQITYGGRTSRRNSVTEMTYSFSRRGSVSAGGGGNGGDYPLPALMAALDASKASQEERRDKSSMAAANAHVNGQASAYLNSIHNFSRQNSSNDSPHGIDSPFGAVNGHHNPMDLQRSDSKARRLAAVKPSQSGHRLERRVSFHNRDQIITQDTVDENGVPVPKPDKPKRKKERTEEEKQARRERKERKERRRQERGESKDRRSKSERREAKNKQHPSGGDLLEQVSAKLQNIEREQCREPLSPVPSSSMIPQASSNHASHHLSATNNTTSTITSNNNVSESANNIKSSAPQPVEPNNNIIVGGPSGVDKLKADNHEPLTTDDKVVSEDNTAGVSMRDEERGSKMSSKRNSLDNKSVQSLAKDLAAECAKAYELMESSLSKLTNDFSIGPFGLTPKNKKKQRAPQPPPLK